MTEIAIDIRAKPISASNHVWKMFPGENYRFLGRFLESGVVFLEAPGLILPHEVITPQSPDMTERLKRVSEVRKWIVSQKRFNRSEQNREPPSRPSGSLKEYSGMSLTRGQFNTLGAIRNLFGSAQKGDLVVVPMPVRNREILIGELLESPDRRVGVEAPEFFLDETTPGRRIRWFPPVNELRIPEALSDVLRIPHGMSQVEKSIESVIYENSYGTFYRPEEYAAQIKINGNDFNAQSVFDFGSLAKFSSVTCFSVDENHKNITSDLQNYSDKLISIDYTPTISLNINSPGVANLTAATVVPILATVLFALFSNCDAQTKPNPSQVKITNSLGGVDDPCAAKIDQTVRQTLSVMGYDQWKAQCERAKRLKEAAGVSVDSQAKVGK